MRIAPRTVWTPEQRIADMNSLGVDVHVVSTGAGFYYYDMDAQTVAAMHRECNDEVHQMTMDYPERLKGFAQIPMQDVKAAIAELDRSVNRLGLVGAMIDDKVNGRTYDDPEFLPLWKAAEQMGALMQTLLAIDVGVKTGLALYGQDGKLRWYRSHNFGSATRLRHGVPTVLHDIPYLAWLILEGGGPLADVWKREAERRHIVVLQISAEVWREHFLYPRQQRRGAQAKAYATEIARRVIVWSQARRPTSLRDDAAEAILIGLWGALELGWLEHLPEMIKR